MSSIGIVFMVLSVIIIFELQQNDIYMKAAISLNFKCRNAIYPQSNVNRFTVPDILVPWITTYDEYKPTFYESPIINGKPWADPVINDKSFEPKWNQLDGKVDRSSFSGVYEVKDKFPLNICGRTGIIGRGLLGRYGPNHAADPIVTRWKRFENKSIVTKSGKNVLQMLAIRRTDNGMLAIPGGMVDAGEIVSSTLKRELIEETLNNATESDVEKVTNFLNGNCTNVYKGYVDDPRNTDNAWMETTACNFHDETGVSLESIKFEAGDDAQSVKWLDITAEIELYANHKDIIKHVVDKLDAFWGK